MLVSLHDPIVLWNKLRQVKLLSRINPLAISSEARVRSRWKQATEPLRHWLQIPMVQRRIRKRISGDESKTFKQFACEKYLRNRQKLDALFLGCGNGANALDWAEEGAFTTMLGLDISPPLIALAQEAARKAGVAERHVFRVADVNALDLEKGQFDVIVFEHSLHHFKDVPNVLKKVRQLLRADGVLLVDEFVGPRRFQWTDQQLAFCDAILMALPEKYRRTLCGPAIKTRHYRAGELLMWLNDPSEAIESDRIESELARQFNITQRLDYGGTISHLVFQDIAHHFATEDPDAQRWGKIILDTEDALLYLGLIKSDFSCMVCSA